MAQRPLIRRLIGLLGALAALLLSSCGPGGPAVATAPRYLGGQMRRFPPLRGAVTPYQTNGPRSLWATSMVDSEYGLFLGTSGGIYRSEDGQTWHPASAGLDDDARNVAFLASAGHTLYAGTSAGLYRSRDGGNSWQFIGSVLGRQPIAGLEKIDNTIFVLAPGGVWRSEIMGDREELWKQVNSGLESAQLTYLTSVGRTLYVVGNDNAFYSENRGDFWKPMPIDGLNAPWQSLASSGGTLLATEGPTGIYRLDAHKDHWVPAGVDKRLMCLSAARLAAAGDTVWGGGAYGICRSDDRGKTWQSTASGPRFVLALYPKQDALYVATVDGLYVTRNRGASWNKLESGLEQLPLPSNAVLGTGGKLYAATYAGIFRSDDRGASWQEITSGLPSSQGGDLAILHNHIFLAAPNGVYRYDERGGFWALTAPWLGTPNVLRLTVAGDRLLAALPNGGVYISDDQGVRWRQSVNGLGSQTVQSLLATQAAVFAGTVNGVYRSTDRGESWQWLRGLENQSVGCLASSPDAIFAGTYAGRVFRLDDPNRGNSWQALESTGLRGPVSTLWIDRRHPNVLIAGTYEGLFWSNDGGRGFSRWSGRRNGQDFRSAALSIASLDGQLFLGTDSGVFYLNDDVARLTAVQRFKDLVTAYPDWFRAGLVVVLVSFVLSSRLILLLLQLDVFGIKNIASAVYLTPWGRWKLYRRYRAAISSEPEMRNHSDCYVDLPYEWPGSSPEEMSRRLSERIGELPAAPRLMIIAQGGRGKTTLCHHIAVRAAEGTLRFHGRRMEPVIVEALAYTGNLLEAVTTSLKRRKAYVNSTIVESQLLTSRLLVLVDGFSEIRQSFRSAADSTDIPRFVKEHPDSGFVFTSRSRLESAVSGSLGGKAVEVRLRDLDAEDERPFLSRYLARGEQEVDSVLAQIKSNFPGLPLIPLMLTLIARVYDETGEVPSSRAKLFGQYAAWILRPEATGLEDTAGLNVALRHLVSETYLKTGDRGMTEEQGVYALGTIKDKLKDFDIDFSMHQLLNLLIRAGLYKSVGQNLRFFHDSFESYYSALALESAFRNRNYECLLGIKINPTFAEVWEFLNEVLAETGDTKRLEDALAAYEKKSVASV